MSEKKNSGEKLNVANVEPFSKYRIAEMAICLIAVAVGLVYLYAPTLIPMKILLPVFAACLIAVAVLRFIGLKNSGTKKALSYFLAVLLAVVAAAVSIVTLLYFTTPQV